MGDLDVGSFKKIKCIFIDPVGDIVYQPVHAGVNQYLGAVDAWKVGNITGAATGRDAVQRCLDDGVGLSMDRTYAVLLDQ